MSIDEEIAELEQMLEENPGSARLRQMLIYKMEGHGGYDDRLEQHLKDFLKTEPHHQGHRNALVRVFFRLNKISACIVLGEELIDSDQAEAATMAIIAKAYLRDNEQGRAAEIYRHLLIENPSYSDAELDKQLRSAAQFTEEEEEEFKLFMEKPNVKFQDVGGLEEVKREIDLKIIKPLQFQDLYKSYGKKAGGGILLYGPPGCGKTFLAKATAGEINSGFINVTLNDILDMWIGNSEKNLHSLFEEARRNHPCVLFFDEIDALGAKRSDLKQSAGRNVINQFLSEMDGVENNNDGVLIIGATNVPWHIDAAFRRPGRFDRIIFIPPPDEKGRDTILQLLLKNKPVGHIDTALIAKQTPHFSGADLQGLVDIAVETIIEEAIQSGTPRKMETKDLVQALSKRKASTLEWFNTAKNYATFANQSGQYNDILQYIKTNKL